MAASPCLFSVCTNTFEIEKAQAEKQGHIKYAHVFRDHYRPEVNPTAARVVYDLTNRVWSPVVYKDGIRRESNFLYSSVIGLDFDGGLNLGEAVKLFKPYRHVIGTTRSHSKDSHRFRVMLKLDRVIEEKNEYKRILTHYIKKFNSDKACKDCARFYYPCTKIISLAPGALLSTNISEVKKKQPKRRKSRVIKFKRHIENFLYIGVPFGAGRNESIYVTTRTLKEMGFDIRIILQMIDQSSFDRNNFSDAEMLRTIQSAWNRP